MGTMKTTLKIAAVSVGVGASLALGTGAASAATLYSGEGYQGITFDQNETRVLRDLGVGHAIEAVMPLEQIGVYLGDGSIQGPVVVDARS
ncbi:hypothetical protein [Prescottella subtropica]|uniref:hypothetical protein n=1 Tax=Prescottella subtropica TaxID=2545757 RepID=UPI0010F8EC91|nr:hypothetical protein [Prescottella subtropica]